MEAPIYTSTLHITTPKKGDERKGHCEVKVPHNYGVGARGEDRIQLHKVRAVEHGTNVEDGKSGVVKDATN